MSILVDNVHVFRVDKDGQGSDICEVLYAATWICGEFASCLEHPHKTLNSMLRAKLDSLPGHIQAAFVQNILKLYTYIMSKLRRCKKFYIFKYFDFQMKIKMKTAL